MSQERRVIVKTSDDSLKEMSEADTVEVFSSTANPSLEDELIVAEETPLLSSVDEATSVEELEDHVAIFENGPTAGQIKAWKKEHGEVYVTSISYDKHIVWRVLSRIEYKHLVKKMEQMMQAGQITSAEANMWNEEAIAELCILFPSYDKRALTEDMAGLPSLISQEVLEASGFVALEVRQL